jgi:(p)ppGpp synthase/HD superfamily hydrolase
MMERAIEIAVEAHKGQADKAGAPYVLHPLRMMLQMQGEVEKLTAVLHDVAEDGPGWTLERLKGEGFPAAVIEALECVTKREGESYEDFIGRAATNPIATRVKLADLEDNMNILRIAEPLEKDWARLKKYHRAWHYLMKSSKH